MKNNQKNTTSKAQTTLQFPKPGTKEHREWQYLHNKERKSKWNTRGPKKTTMKEIHELNEIFPGRNSFSFSISLDKNSSKDSLARIEEQALTNMPACGEIKNQKGESRSQKYKISDTLTIEVVPLREFPEMGRCNPPKVAPAPPKKQKFVRYHGVNKPFSEFTPLDWHNWHKNKAAYHVDTLTREYAKKRRLVLDLPAGIMGERDRSLDSPRSMPRLPLSERIDYSSASGGVPISAILGKLQGSSNGAP